MRATKDGVGHIVKVSLTGLTVVMLAMDLVRIPAIFNDLSSRSMGKDNARRPVNNTQCFVALSDIQEFM